LEQVLAVLQVNAALATAGSAQPEGPQRGGRRRGSSPWTLDDWLERRTPLSLTVAETAAAFGVSTATVYNQIKAGDIPIVPHMSVARTPAIWIRERMLEQIT
jgi:hypothetical protein